MHRSSRIAIVVCLVLLLVAGCSDVFTNQQVLQADLPRIEAPMVSEAQEALLRDGNNAFAFNLYHDLMQENPGNLMYSPYSIWLAFSMIYAGAHGDTESQLADIFHFLNQESQHVTLNAIDQRLQAYTTPQAADNEGTPFQLEVANAVWSQQGYAFNQSYLDLLATQYGAGLGMLDFQKSAETAREAINAWVDKRTDGRIKKIAAPGSISEDTRLVLTNAILFKASWAYKFDRQATVDSSFSLVDGTQVTTPFMHLKAALDYFEGDDYRAVRLPYVNHNAEMWIILPNESRFEAVQDGLGSELIKSIQGQAHVEEVTLTLPKFDFESDIPLNEPLTSMGLTEAFCPAGDYGGIAEDEGLCIGQAVHKANITVDEEGTEATAATMAAMPVSIMQEIELKVDRPFLFAIMDRDSGLILFLGQLLDPTIH